MKISERTARFEVSNLHTIQNTKTVTKGYTTEIAIWQKISSESQSSEYVVKIFKKYI